MAGLLLITGSVPSPAEELRIAMVSRTVFYVPWWIADRQLSVSVPGLRAVFAAVQSGNLLAVEERFDPSRVVDDTYLSQHNSRP